MTSTPEPGLRDANGRRSEMLVDLLQCATIIYEIFAEDRAKAMAELLEGEDASRDVYLAGDDFLPIFIFVAARCSAVHAGGMALATMQEWMMRMGASTDASHEEYMGTTLGMAISALIHLEPGATTESSPETTTGSGRGSEG